MTGTPVPPLSAVRYYEPRGYGRAFTGRYEPFATVSLTVELPFGNRTARGRVAQAEAALTSSAIQTRDLRRTIGDNVVEVAEALRRAADSLTERQAAVTRGLETLGGRMQMFQVGDATLIDVLMTEEGLTGDTLSLVRQRQAYLSALARMRLELGQLAEVGGTGAPADSIRFDSRAFTATP